MKRAIDSHSMMSRLRAMVGLKRADKTIVTSYVAITKFKKELKEELDKCDLPIKEIIAIEENAIKIADSKMTNKFKALEWYVERNGWKATIDLLSKRRESNTILKDIIEERERRSNGHKTLENNKVTYKDLEETFKGEEEDED